MIMIMILNSQNDSYPRGLSHLRFEVLERLATWPTRIEVMLMCYMDLEMDLQLLPEADLGKEPWLCLSLPGSRLWTIPVVEPLQAREHGIALVIQGEL
jgi:hypothetical protein